MAHGATAMYCHADPSCYIRVLSPIGFEEGAKVLKQLDVFKRLTLTENFWPPHLIGFILATFYFLVR